MVLIQLLELHADRVGASPERWHLVFESAKLRFRKSAVLVLIEKLEDLLRAAIDTYLQVRTYEK